MRKMGGRAIVFAASAVVAVGAWTPAVRAGHEAHAAGTPGWRVVHVFGSCFGILNSVTAIGVNDAWATGVWYPCTQNHVHQVARWNGRAWQDLSAPSGFGVGPGFESSSGTAIAALSSSYSWVFVNRTFDPQPTIQSFAQLLRGGRWRTFRLANGSTITSAVTFSRSNAWAFGSIPSGQGTAAYAARFNGKQWRRIPIPIVPEATAAPGRHNIWAVGPVDSAAAYPFPRRWGLAHWTDRWHTTPMPNLNLSPGRHIEDISVVTDGSGGAWVAIRFFNNGPQPYANGGVLLHWTGKIWVNVVPTIPTDGLGPLAHDGHGGLWIATTPQCCSRTAMINYSASGTWTQTSTPLKFLTVQAMRQLPGTESVWAAGYKEVCNDFGCTDIGVMLKYAPG